MRAQIPVGWTVYFCSNQYVVMLDDSLRMTYSPLVSMIAGRFGHLHCLSDHGCRLVLSCELSEWGVVQGQLWYLVGEVRLFSVDRLVPNTQLREVEIISRDTTVKLRNQ